MRLIDADKLMESLDPKESVWVGLVLSELIANAPTVKAIPVEWLQKKLDKWKDRDLLGWSLCVKLLIEDWEKENANNN